MKQNYKAVAMTRKKSVSCATAVLRGDNRTTGERWQACIRILFKDEGARDTTGGSEKGYETGGAD